VGGWKGVESEECEWLLYSSYHLLWRHVSHLLLRERKHLGGHHRGVHVAGGFLTDTSFGVFDAFEGVDIDGHAMALFLVGPLICPLGLGPASQQFFIFYFYFFI
jgi:hypothetical protein